MKPIENWQFKKMYAIAGSLGMVGRGREDDLHVLTAALTGKESLKSLSYSEAATVIAELEVRQGNNPIPRRKKSAAPSRPGGITPEQQAKVWALIGELEKYDKRPGSRGSHKQRVCVVIKKEFGMDASPTSPFQWLTMKHGIQLIDALKRYVGHEHRKAEQKGGVEK